MSRSGKKPLLAVIALFLAFALTGAVFAQVNVRVANIANKFNRLMTGRFLKGYYLLEQSVVSEKGKGSLGGDSVVSKVYATKNPAEFKKLTDDKSILKLDITKIVIKVEVFEKHTVAQKVKFEKAESGSFSGAIVGDQAWNVTAPKKGLSEYKLMLEEKAAKEKEEKEPKETEPKDKKTGKKEPPPKKLSPREQRLKDAADKKKAEEEAAKDKELQKVLDADATNYNAKQLIVRKKNVIISIVATNYVKMPDDGLLEGIARTLTESIATKGM